MLKKFSKENTGKKLEHRAWYSKYELWLDDNIVPKNAIALPEGSLDTQQEEDNDIYVVPFDEQFTRCPVSKEQFETFWDDDEGGLMFRNAVKVLVTEAADANIFQLGKPTSVADVRYCVVHKLLVMDGWVSNGKAVRLSSLSTEKQDLVNAAGDEDEDDIFVIIA